MIPNWVLNVSAYLHVEYVIMRLLLGVRLSQTSNRSSKNQ